MLEAINEAATFCGVTPGLMAQWVVEGRVKFKTKWDGSIWIPIGTNLVKWVEAMKRDEGA